MIKYKTFYSQMDVEDRISHDSSIRKFLEELCNAGHSFMSIKTDIYGLTQNLSNRMRTEIVYQENPKREVITEKTEQN